MDSQPEDLSVLMRIKRRRLADSIDDTVTNHGTRMTGTPSSLSMFVQSALKHTPSECRPSESRRRSGSSISSRNKKQKIASQQLEKWPEAIGFSGYSESDEEGEERGSAGNIDVFSESGSEQSDKDSVCVSDEGSVGEDEREYKRPNPIRKKLKRSVKSKNKSSKHFSSLQSTAGTDLTVQEIDSCSSESSVDHTHTPTPPPQHITAHTTTLHTSTPAHHSMTVKDFYSNLAMYNDSVTAPTTSEEYNNIVTPPSSPEMNTDKRSSRTTTSEWIRQITLESNDSTTSHGVDSSNNTTLAGLGDSAEKERKVGRWGMGKRRKGRVVPGGLADAVERVSLRESSEITFWEHRARHINDADIDLSACLTVKVCSLINDHSLKVAKCIILKQQQQQPLSQQEHPASLQEQHTQSSSRQQHPQVMNGSGTTLDIVSRLSSRSHIETVGESRPDGCGVVEQEEGSGTMMKPGEREGGGEEEEELVTVLFSLRCSKFLDLQVGHHVRIHPPWQCLTMSSSRQERVIFCSHFCQVLTLSPTHNHSLTSHSTHHHNPTPHSSLTPHKHIHSTSLNGINIWSPTIIPHSSFITKSAGRVHSLVPTRLFSTDTPTVQESHVTSTNAPLTYPQHTTVSSGQTEYNTNRQNACTIKSLTKQLHNPKNLPDTLTNDASPSLSIAPAINDDNRGVSPGPDRESDGVCFGLLSAIENNNINGVLNFKGRVMRVYRRTVYSTTATLSSGGSIGHGLLTKSAHLTALRSRWCMLVCDVTGMLCELQVSDLSNQTWSELVKRGEGNVYYFRDIRVSCRTNPTRNPELFTLIRYLCGQMMVHSTTHSGQTLDSEVMATPIPIPSYCYVLVSGPESVSIPCQSGDEIQILTINNNTLSTISTHHHNINCEVIRCIVYARVVYYQPEVPLAILESYNHLTPHYGHYLFIVTPSHSTLSSQASSHETHHMFNDDTTQLLCVYVKPNFPREDVKHLLCSPGQRIIIRDMEMRREKDCIRYSIDTCSLIHSPSLPNHIVYPQYKLTSDEESILLNLPPPTIPHFTTLHSDIITTISGVIVGIDEDSAFSWFKCDTCSNDRLITTTLTGTNTHNGKETLYCDSCQRRVDTPLIHLQLTVYIQPSNHFTNIVCVQLMQSTIRKLLPVSSKSLNEGFDVKHILKESVCLDACYVHGTRQTKYGQTTPYLQEICITPQSPTSIYQQF